MVYEQFRVHTEGAVQQFIVFQRTHCDIPHSEDAESFKPCGISASDPPEIGYGRVMPKLLTIAHLIELCDTDTVLVCGDVLRDDIHCDLCKIHISAYAGSRRYGCCRKNVTYHTPCEFMRCQAVCVQIRGRVDEHFIYRINVYIFRGDVFQINIVYPGAYIYIVRHSRFCGDIVKFERRVCRELRRVHRLSCEPVTRGVSQTLGVYLLDTLHHLEQACSAADAVSFQRRRDRETDSFFCSAHICYDEIGGQRVKPEVCAFRRCVE